MGMSAGMTGPTWLADIFAALTLLVALSGAGRLVVSRRVARPVHVDVEVEHLLMGVGMAGMFVPALNALPTPVWETAFALMAAWFVWRGALVLTGRSTGQAHAHPVSHYPSHLVMSLAMLYMYFAAPAGSGGGAMGTAAMAASGTTADFVGLPLLFLLVLMASCTWELDRASRSWRAAATPAEVPTAAVVAVPVGGDGTALAAAVAPAPAADGGHRTDEPPLLAPGLMAAAHVVMCVAMGYMLIVML